MTRAEIWRLSLRVTLAVSLLLNAIVLGLAIRVGGVLNDIGLEGTRLPADLRRAFAETMQGPDGDPVRLAVSELAEARRAVVAAGEAAPFDEDAVRAAMAEVREKTTAAQVQGQALLLDVMRQKSERP